MEGWGAFVEDMRQFYGMDLDCLSRVRTGPSCSQAFGCIVLMTLFHQAPSH